MGLDYLGQTFYYSRTLTEELESPMIQVGTVNQTVSIFLDDTLIYTDCPELDNRIGELELPMLEFDRCASVRTGTDFTGSICLECFYRAFFPSASCFCISYPVRNMQHFGKGRLLFQIHRKSAN